MGNPKQGNEHSARVAKRKDQNPERKPRSESLGRERRMEIAIEGITVTVGLLLIVATVIGVSDIASKLVITLWLCGAAVVLTLLGFGLSYQKRVWEAISASASVRPELSIGKSALYLSEGKPLEVRTLIKNLGSVAALDIELRSTYFFGPPKYADHMVHDPLTPTDKYRRLSPTAESTTITFCGEGLTRKQLLELQNNISIFILYTDGEYWDEQGNTYPIEFCLMYDPAYPFLKNCPEKYWPKNQNG